MDYRERVLTAIHHEEPDRVPIAINGSAYGITDPLYFDLLKYLDLGEPVPPFRTRRGHSVNYHDDRLMERLDIDVRYVWIGFTDLGSPPAGGGLDAWGIGWQQTGIYLTATEHPLGEATLDDLDKYSWPDVEKFIRRDELRKRAKYLQEKTDYAVVGRAVDSYGPMERSSVMRRMDNLMMDMLWNEKFVMTLAEKITDVLCRLLEIYLDEAGQYLDIMQLPMDDYAAKNPLIAPEMFDKFYAPSWRRMIRLIKEAAPHCKIWFHSDGRMEPFLSRLIDLGVDVFHCLEYFPGLVDMGQIKRDYGDKLCFWGGIDIKEALQGDVERVQAEVKERIKALGPGGGYILAPANHVQPDVPAENLVALFSAARQYGEYPLRNLD